MLLMRVKLEMVPHQGLACQAHHWNQVTLKDFKQTSQSWSKKLTLFDSHCQKKIHKTCYNQCIVPSTPPNHSRQCQACSQGRSGWMEAQPFERNARAKWIDLEFKKFHWKKWSFITPRTPGRALQIAREIGKEDGVWEAKDNILWLYLPVKSPHDQFLC